MACVAACDIHHTGIAFWSSLDVQTLCSPKRPTAPGAFSLFCGRLALKAADPLAGGLFLSGRACSAKRKLARVVPQTCDDLPSTLEEVVFVYDSLPFLAQTRTSTWLGS